MGLVPGQRSLDGRPFARALREYLIRRADEFDVVEYDHQDLPFPRADFPARTLFVARSVLLVHFMETLQPPELLRVHQRLKAWLTRSRARARPLHRARVGDARATVAAADLVNVANEDERRLLTAEGVAPEKIVVIPYGLNPAEFAALAGSNAGEQRPEPPRVCFVGTFDGRKGGADLPRIFARVARRVPGVRFRLLGTAGLHQTEAAVRSFFPRWLRGSLEVVMRFGRPDLARWLDGCTAGVFPSYLEGFGFGVLEMLAAGIPVVAYRSPGPPMMLPDDRLVAPGDVDAMADRLIALLDDKTDRARVAARARARDFPWTAAAQMTDACYRRLCLARREEGRR